MLLHLKKGAPLILNINITDQLVNGLMVPLLIFNQELLQLIFKRINKHGNIPDTHLPIIQSKSGRIWEYVFNSHLSSHLDLQYINHKALRLRIVRIDCRNMTNSGQIGISVGRAKAKRDLRIINVNKYLLRPHPQSVCDYYQGVSAPLKEDCTCCKTSDSGQVFGGKTMGLRRYDTGCFNNMKMVQNLLS